MKYINKKNVLIFAGGAICSMFCNQLGKRSCVRTAAVKVVAKGLQAKDSVNYTIASIKEEAEDIYHEAQAEVGKDASCGCGCSDTKEGEE